MGAISIYMVNLGKKYWKTVKRILWHIKGTSDVVLYYGGSEFIVRGYWIKILWEILIKVNLILAMSYTCGRSCKLGFKTTDCYGIIYDRSRVYGIYLSLQKAI